MDFVLVQSEIPESNEIVEDHEAPVCYLQLNRDRREMLFVYNRKFRKVIPPLPT
jgi:hypothetical protein